MTPSDVASDRARAPGVVTWRRFLVAGLTLTAVVLVVPGWTGELLWDVVPVLACAAMVVGVRRHRGPVARAWWWLTAGVAWWTAADLTWTGWYVAVGDADVIPWWFDILYMPTYALLTVGLALLPRNSLRSPHETATMDAVVVVVGAGLLYWALVFRSFLGPDALQDAAHLISVVSLGAGLVVVLLASRLLFRYGGRNGAYVLLGGGVAASTAGDVLYTLTLIGDGNPGISVLDTSLAEGVGSAAWLVWFVLSGAAALHPGAVGSPDAEPTRGLTLVRGVVFFVLACLGPAALLLLEFREGPTVTMAWSDLAVPVLALTALSAFLVARLVVGTSTAQRRAIQLDRQAAELAHALHEQSALQRLLTHQAEHDPLTGLGNRTRFTERLSAPDRRGSGERAVLMVDLDGFKSVNDDHGHHVGDDLLVQVARRLRRVVGGDDTLARLGGDEFAVVLEDTDEADARDVATRVVHALGEPFVVDGRTVRVTSSVGVRLVDASVEPQATLRDADLALYAAKAAGKNQVRLFDPGLRVEQDRRSHLAEGLRHAVERDELVVHYQPVVALDTGRVQSVEALLRWQSPDGLVMPDGFIPVAEDTGLIVPIGEHVLRRACADVRPWFERYGVRVHVNVSARQLREPDVVDQVLRALHDADLPGDALVLEITETALLAAEQPEATLVESHLSRLREHGVRVAIDDFGTGYSSLAYLQRLPVDIVKIDGAFTRFAAEPGDEGRRRRALASAIVDLCASLDLPAVAEQIETDDEAEALRALGCPEGQGYLFGRPAPREDIAGLLERSPRLSTVPAPRPPHRAQRPV